MLVNPWEDLNLPDSGSWQKGKQIVSAQAVARRKEHAQPSTPGVDNWRGFVGDILTIKGEVRFKSMLRVDGHLSGQVFSADGTLIVACGALVTEALIDVAVAKIEGTVEGDIHASKELVLGRTASVTGKVTTPEFIVEEGALFNGTCRRTEFPRNSPD